jgi:hypothetical protein
MCSLKQLIIILSDIPKLLSFNLLPMRLKVKTAIGKRKAITIHWTIAKSA